MSLINEALKKAQKQRAAEDAAKSGAVLPPGAGELNAGGTPPAPPRPPQAPASGGAFGDDAGGGRIDPLVAARTRRSGGGLSRWALPAGVGLVLLVAGGWWLGRGGDGDADGVVGNADAGLASQTPTADGGNVGALLATPGEGEAVRQTKDADLAITAVAGQGQATTEAQGPIEEVAIPTVSIGPSQPAAAAVESVETDTSPKIVSVPERASSSPQNEVGGVEPTRVTSSLPSAAPVPEPRSQTLSAEPPGEIPTRAAGGGLTILSDTEARSSARAAGGTAVQPQEVVLRYLERARVTGVRLSTTDPKVLFNDRVYRLNDVVDRDLQLRVIGIADRELRFQDAQGYVYTKSF